MRKRDSCYSTDFEERIAKALESDGHKVYRSVYASHGEHESQIDLVVLDRGMPVCIECKGYDAIRMMYKRSGQWSYLGYDNAVHQISNPIKQVDRQAKNLATAMRADIEDALPDNLTIPHALCAVILKGDISDYVSEHVYTERSLDKLLEFCRGADFELDKRLSDDMHKWLSEHSDTSKERLKAHAKYIRECKKNKTGAFSVGQGGGSYMTLEERILMRYTSLNWKEVQRMKTDFETSERAMKRHIEGMKPHINQAPEFLGVDALDKLLMKHIYSDICEYGWALQYLRGFDEVKAVAERHGLQVKMDAPENDEDYISPSIFAGFIWGVLKENDLRLYSQLPGVTLRIKRKQYELTNMQIEALKARGMRAWCEQHELYFEGNISPDYTLKYREKGFLPVYDFDKSTAQAIEKEVKRWYPDAHLQYDSNYGVVIK